MLVHTMHVFFLKLSMGTCYINFEIKTTCVGTDKSVWLRNMFKCKKENNN